MRINVRLFARLRELAGTGEVGMDVGPGLTVAGLATLLRERLPRLGDSLDSAAAAVNGETAQPDVTLKAGDEVAFLPPFSGGASVIARSPVMTYQRRRSADAC